MRFDKPTVRSLLALALLSLAGCSSPSAPAPEPVEPRTIVSAGRARTYLLMPARATGDTVHRPLVLVYHGSGGNALELAQATSLSQVAIANGLIIAFLESMPGTNGNWAVNPVDLEIVDDLTYTRDVVADIERVHRIDHTRRFAIGYSRGGDFVYSAMCREPEYLRGAVAVAATARYSIDEWCDETKDRATQTALAMVMGASDPLMPWDGGLSHRKGVEETARQFAARNGCATTYSSTSVPARSGYTVTRMSYAPCNKADVRLYRAVGLQHNWPAYAFDAERIMIGWLLGLPGS